MVSNLLVSALDGPRKDCGYVGIDRAACQDKGCCWQPIVPNPGAPHVDQPWCFYTNAGTSEYRLHKVQDTGQEVTGVLHNTKRWLPELGADLSPLQLEIDLQPDSVHIKLTTADDDRWEVPVRLLRRSAQDQKRGLQSTLYDLKYKNDPFQVEVFRSGAAADAEPVFSTVGQRLVFKDQYLEVGTRVPPSSSLYGAGERSFSTGLRLLRDGLPLALWNTDIGARLPDRNLYGSQPFVMEIREDGSANGLLLLNSNGMDVVATNTSLSLRAIGGVLDLYILLGPTPAHVMDQMTRVVGKPAMPPAWSLGFHQCKYGYTGLEEVRQVVANYSAAHIPLEAIWTDIDYMDRYKDFTFDPKNWPQPEFKKFVEELHAKNQSWVPIVDPGILKRPGYKPYEDGLKAGAFVKDITGQPYLGLVWPGAVHYPDFLGSAGVEYWKDQLRDFHELAALDGVWIDMNEASNFCTGHVCKEPPGGMLEVPRENQVLNVKEMNACDLDCSATLDDLGHPEAKTLEDPPYKISNGNNLEPLNQRTLPVTAVHANGEIEYNTHNLYGLSEARATYQALEAVRGSRPFVLTRSWFLGTGAYSAHWTGDNAATWDDMRWSITSVFASGLSGIPFAGADICGFSFETNEELCSRWISLGAFYPFSRDHSDLYAGYQELYRWPSVADAGRRALGMRYRMLPYLYTAFHDSVKFGCPVARPLFFGYPADLQTHSIDEQFLLGDSVLISPALHQGTTAVDAYFPAGTWYSMWDHSRVEGGRRVKLDVPLGAVPLHVQAGTIIPLQQAGLTVAATLTAPLTLLVALPTVDTGDLGMPGSQAEGLQRGGLRCATSANEAATRQLPQAAAYGKLFVDDGESVATNSNSSGLLTFTAWLTPGQSPEQTTGQLELRFEPEADFTDEMVDGWCRGTPFPALQEVVVLGLPHAPDPASLQLEIIANHGKVLASTKPANAQVHYEPHLHRLRLTGLRSILHCPHQTRVTWKSSVRAITAVS
ncbi:hypothetical protein WJX72_009486 [[Myrmecia] bisecta]|uniref:alpha-glucosidase n=1 Tax=[Myrmecia] bisecta TaxID=41462 RepID=A0AAW1QTA4_9CHLO